MQTSEAECLDALREAAERLGTSPTKAEYEELGLTPSSTTIRRLFGGWNQAKEQAALETFDHGDNGGVDVQPKPEGVDIPDGTEWSELTSQQRWYYKNRRHRIDVKENRRKEIHRWFYELKRDETSCSECEEDRAPALDFHHLGEKTQDVSAMVNDGYSKRRIRVEIERCVVLCSNCHRKKHYDGPHPAVLPERSDIETSVEAALKHEARRRRRDWLVAYKRDSDGCERCATSSPACLDLHHTSEKHMRIGKMVSFDYTLPEIQRELERCVIVCANCHRVEHFEPPADC